MAGSGKDGAAEVTAIVRAGDPDRYLAALYAPEERRGALLALYAFNVEIARVRDVVRDPLPGEVRLQWWRDCIAGEEHGSAAGNPVASLLLEAIERFDLPRAAFENYLEARLFDLYDDAMPGRTALEGYCGETAGALIQLASLVLDPEAAVRHGAVAGHAGCAQAITGLIRLMPIHRARGQCYVPAELLAASGLGREQYLSEDTGPGGAAIVAAMSALAREHHTAFLKAASALPRSLMPAYLPLAPVPAYLSRIDTAGTNALTQTPDISALRRNWLILRRAQSGF